MNTAFKLGQFGSILKDLNGRFAFGSKLRLHTYANLYRMQNNGLPIDASLERLLERKTARNRPERIVIKAWHDGMKQGRTFAESIRDFVPATELVLISAGERSGNLGLGIEQAHRVTTAAQQMRKVLVARLTMPAILFVMLGALIVGFSTKMAPEFAKTLPPSEWSASGQALYAFSSFVKSFWLHCAGGVIAIVGTVAYSLPRWTGPIRGKFDRIPPWSIYRSYISATFMIALSALMTAGVPLSDAIKYIRANASDWTKSHLAVMVNRIRAGDDYGEAMDTGLLDEETSDNVMIYSKIADFNKAILDVGNQVIDDAIERITIQAAVANTVSTLFIGLMLAWIITVMQDVTQRASQQSSNPIAAHRTQK